MAWYGAGSRFVAGHALVGMSGAAACLLLRRHRLDQSPQDLVHGIGRSEHFGYVGVQSDDKRVGSTRDANRLGFDLL